MTQNIVSSVKQMYEEAGLIWHVTRSKKYPSTGNANWPVLQNYLDKLKPTERILDVGCGDGRLITGLPDGVEYLGIDFSQSLLDQAAKAHPTHTFRYGNILETNTWEKLGNYDAIFCVAVLHHIPTREEQLFVLRKMRSALRHQGFLFLSVWNLWQEKFLQHHLNSLELKKINPSYVEIPFANKWKRFCYQMDIPYLFDLAKESGWNVDEIFFADRDGKKSDIQKGQNLVMIAR